MKNGTEAFKAGFEKTVKNYDQLVGYGKETAFEAYVGQVTKLSELFVATIKEAFEPLQGRVQAWMEVVQSARAALLCRM